MRQLYCVANDHLRKEHLEASVWQRRPVAVAVTAISSEVYGFAPHTCVGVDNVEPRFALVYELRVRQASSVVQIADLGIFAYFIFKDLFLSLEDSPDALVLNPLDLDYVAGGHRFPELGLDALILRAVVMEVDHDAVLIPSHLV